VFKMGGSGGSWSVTRAEKLQEKVYDAQQKSKEDATKSEINDILGDKLKEYNDRDVEQINQHLDTVKEALEKDIEGSLDLMFGGSVSKHTYVDGLSDVDILVGVNESSLASSKPQDVLDYFYTRLRERLPNSDIKKGSLAITINFKSGNEIQLLPALKTKTGLKISKVDTNQWSNVLKPKKFGKEITKINSEQSGKVVPVIKLCKSINDNLGKKYQLSGYHIEALAVKTFKNYDGKKDYYSMLEQFCKSISTEVMRPMRERTGQSFYIDRELGKSNSESRKIVSRKYNRIAKSINKIVTGGNAKKIKEIV